VALEAGRRKEIATDVSPVASIEITNHSDEFQCLLRCLQFLTPAKRDLILDYHLYEGRDKIEQHRLMAHELGISDNALRVRAHHIRSELEKCVDAMHQELAAGNKSRRGKHIRQRAGYGASAMAQAEEYKIKEYLLGRLNQGDEEQVELRLLGDPDFAEEYDMLVDEITDDYIAGKFAGEDLEQVEQYFLKSNARRNKLKFALALKKQKAARDSGKGGKKSSFMRYLAIAASVIVLAVGGFYLWRVQSRDAELNHGLASLQSAFREERPFEARISKLDYAPYLATRGPERESRSG